MQEFKQDVKQKKLNNSYRSYNIIATIYLATQIAMELKNKDNILLIKEGM